MSEHLEEKLFDEINALYELGNTYLAANEIDKALQQYENAYSKIPVQQHEWELAEGILLATANAYYVSNNFKKTLETIYRIKSYKTSNNPFLHLRLSQAYLGLHENEKANEHISKAYLNGGIEIFEDELTLLKYIITSNSLYNGDHTFENNTLIIDRSIPKHWIFILVLFPLLLIWSFIAYQNISLLIEHNSYGAKNLFVVTTFLSLASLAFLSLVWIVLGKEEIKIQDHEIRCTRKLLGLKSDMIFKKQQLEKVTIDKKRYISSLLGSIKIKHSSKHYRIGAVLNEFEVLYIKALYNNKN